MILVADCSALVALSVCNQLNLLEQLFASVAVPETVYCEATRPDKHQAQVLKQFLQGKVHKVDLRNYVFLDASCSPCYGLKTCSPAITAH